VETWQSNWEVPNYDQVAITVIDGFKWLSRADVSQILPSGLSGTQIGTVLDRALYPRSTRAVDAGVFIMADSAITDSVKAKDLLQTISESELGIVFMNHAADRAPFTFHDRAHRWTQTRSTTSQASFSDAGAGLRYQDLEPSFDDTNVVNIWTVTDARGGVHVAIDTVSRAENGPSDQSRTTLLDNTTDATDQAANLLQQTARPQLRFDSFRLRLTANTSSATWISALTLAISDRVTVTRTPVPAAGGSTITRDCFIEAISWNIMPGIWDLTLQLSPVSTMAYQDTIPLDNPVSFWLFNTTT
jgi:hypothetical protein